MRSLTSSGDTRKYGHSVLPEPRFSCSCGDCNTQAWSLFPPRQRTISIQITLFVTFKTYINEILYPHKNILLHHFNKLHNVRSVSLIGNKIAFKFSIIPRV